MTIHVHVIMGVHRGEVPQLLPTKCLLSQSHFSCGNLISKKEAATEEKIGDCVGPQH